LWENIVSGGDLNFSANKEQGSSLAGCGCRDVLRISKVELSERVA
jgi:hypothetical protein